MIENLQGMWGIKVFKELAIPGIDTVACKKIEALKLISKFAVNKLLYA